MQTASNYIPHHAYPATVPLSVYRDLATELQTAQTQIQQLATQNQQLFRENQLLRQEINHTIQAIMRLQDIANGTQPFPVNSANQYVPNPAPVTEIPQRTAKAPRVAPPPRQTQTRRVSHKQKSVDYFPRPEPVYIEEQEIGYYNEESAETSAMNSWWMLLAIAFIVLTAFGAGYLVVKPFIDSQTN